MVVLLPAPLGPRKPKMLPPRHLEGDAVHGLHRATVMFGEILDNNSLIDHTSSIHRCKDSLQTKSHRNLAQVGPS